MPWIKKTEIVKEGGDIVDIPHEGKENDDHHPQHRNDIYDTSGTDAPLYPNKFHFASNKNGHDGLTTIV